MDDLRVAIQPLSIGEIADRSVTLAATRWRTLLALVLIEALPIGIWRALSPPSELASFLRMAADILISAPLYAAAVLATVAPNVPPPAAALKAAMNQFGASLAALLLSLAWFCLWLLVTAFVGALGMASFLESRNSIAIGVAGSVAAGIAGLGLLPRAGLISAVMLPIVILERVSPWQAFTRARRRVNHIGFQRSSLLGLTIFALTQVPSFLSAASVDMIAGIPKLRALFVFQELLSDAATLGFGIVIATVIALEMRARSEGTDISAELGPSAS